MSLVGNLEDLSLGDIMQIISLSQKSGVLVLQTEEGEGRIVFSNGLVEASTIKGYPEDLSALLSDGGFIDPAEFEAVRARAGDVDTSIEDALEKEHGLTPERIEALLRESVESNVLAMFTWMAGSFSFDVRQEPEPDDPRLSLPTGINPQFLAMEGMRLRDELEHANRAPDVAVIDPNDPFSDMAPSAPAEAPSDAALDEEAEIEEIELTEVHEVLAEEVEPVQEAVAAEEDFDAVSPPAELAVEEVERAFEEAAADIVVGAVLEDEAEGDSQRYSDDDTLEDVCVAPASAVAEADTEEPPATDEEPALTESIPPVVLIDPDVTVLEWGKQSLEGECPRVHVFQQAEQGLSRIRQYLVRGEVPIVLMSPETEVDPLSGIRGLGDFVKRLKDQASRLPVFVLFGSDTEEGDSAYTWDGRIMRPELRTLRGSDPLPIQEASEALPRVVRERLAQVRAGVSVAQAPARTPLVLKDLDDATRRLEEASSRGEILPLVIDYAAEVFDRVAVLMPRGKEVIAIAGRGIQRLDDEGMMTVSRSDEGWVHRVLESGGAVTAPPTAEADRALLECFGDVVAEESYVAPIGTESGIVALLYADLGSSGGPLPDTDELEVVLQHAALALERAARERTSSQDEAV